MIKTKVILSCVFLIIPWSSLHLFCNAFPQPCSEYADPRTFPQRHSVPRFIPETRGMPGAAKAAVTRLWVSPAGIGESRQRNVTTAGESSRVLETFYSMKEAQQLLWRSSSGQRPLFAHWAAYKGDPQRSSSPQQLHTQTFFPLLMRSIHFLRGLGGTCPQEVGPSLPQCQSSLEHSQAKPERTLYCGSASILEGVGTQ